LCVKVLCNEASYSFQVSENAFPLKSLHTTCETMVASYKDWCYTVQRGPWGGGGYNIGGGNPRKN